MGLEPETYGLPGRSVTRRHLTPVDNAISVDDS